MCLLLQYVLVYPRTKHLSDYHHNWGSNWSGSNVLAVCGDEGETGFPRNGIGFGVYTSYHCSYGPAWEDAGSRLSKIP